MYSSLLNRGQYKTERKTLIVWSSRSRYCVCRLFSVKGAREFSVVMISALPNTGYALKLKTLTQGYCHTIIPKTSTHTRTPFVLILFNFTIKSKKIKKSYRNAPFRHTSNLCFPTLLHFSLIFSTVICKADFYC